MFNYCSKQKDLSLNNQCTFKKKKKNRSET